MARRQTPTSLPPLFFRVLSRDPRGHAEDYALDDPGGRHQVLDGDQELRREMLKR